MNNSMTAYSVNTQDLAKSDAEKTGAVMNFGEKYGDVVRVVKMDDYSIEFCGGTHVKNTGEIKLFLISKESSPGAGNRRIEALSSDRACQKIMDLENSMLQALAGGSSQIQDNFRKEFSEIENKILAEVRKSESEKFSINHWHTLKDLHLRETGIIALNKKALKKENETTGIDESILNSLIDNLEMIGNFHVVSGLVEGGIPQMKSMVDFIRSKKPDSIAVLASSDGAKWNLVMATSHAYAEKNKIDLSNLIKKLLADFPEIQGGGGGKKELVQGSGTLPSATRGEFLHDLLIKIKDKINGG